MAELPKNAADPAARAQAITDRAALYNFQIRAGMGMTMLQPLNSVVPEPLGSFELTNMPMLPPQEEPDGRWYDANEAAVLNSGGSGGFSFIHNIFMNKPRFPFDTQSHEQRLDNFYSAYVDGLGRPAVADDWFTDQSFCLQRLCGVNPVKIQRVRSPAIIDDPADCAIDASHFGSLLDNMTLTTAINTNLVYVCDYAELAPAAGSITGQFGETRYLTAPIAVFFWKQGTNPGEQDGWRPEPGPAGGRARPGPRRAGRTQHRLGAACQDVGFRRRHRRGTPPRGPCGGAGRRRSDR